jgi:hypothetical protein
MSGEEDQAHREWLTDDLDIYLCLECRKLEARRKNEPEPVTHSCGGAWSKVEDAAARRAMLRVLTNQLFKVPRT